MPYCACVRSTALLLVALTLVASTALAASTPTPSTTSSPATVHSADPSEPPPYLLGPGETHQIVSHGTGSSRSLAKACPDTFALYGGPGSLEGRFENAQRLPDRQGWIGLDHTQIENFWHVSTFNAENLADHGAGNQAMWCGQSAEDQPGWATPPGYGNNWLHELVWTSGPLNQIDQGQTVQLDFYFNYDVEPGYDFFLVQYDSAGIWKSVLSLDGSNRDSTGVFLGPGLRYSDTAASTIQYSGLDYGGDQGDEIRLRLYFTSDLAWSDEDGLWDTDGAVQVDDLSVTWMDGGTPMSSFEDFEGAGPYAWQAETPPFAGDFTKVFIRFEDIDPCRENDTPVMTWIDDGTPPANDPLGRSTGGSLSPTWSYGVPGGWVVNFTGGLSFGVIGMHNSVLTPPIAWDLPGTCDDSPDVVDLFIRWDHFQHAPYGVLPTYEYRYSTDGAITWSRWFDAGFFWVGGSQWFTEQANMDVPVGVTPTHVQWAFTMWDVADIFGLPSDDSTPASVIDNVSVYKARVAGPQLVIPTLRKYNDGFPVSGTIAVGTQAERDDLDIPFFGLWDDPTGFGGDLRVGAKAEIAGSYVTETHLHWILEKNPLFEDAIRTIPARPQDVNVEASDPLVWRGEVLGALVDGDSLDGWWSVDLPDSDFFYPGDRLRYHVSATDSDGRVATVPGDVSQFDAGTHYPEYLQIRGLPTITSAAGAQPPLLMIPTNGSSKLFEIPDQLGMVRGVDYDVFYKQGTFVNWNLHGIGAAGGHGANADQLVGYSAIVLEVRGSPGWPVIGDGITGNSSDDVGVLTAWRGLPGPRDFAVFGQDAGQTLQLSAPMQTFLATVLSAGYNDGNLRDEIGGQQAPVVQPMHPSFGQTFVAHGPCPTEQGFDSIVPIGAATMGHALLSSGGTPVPGLAGSILHEQTLEGDLKKTVLMPFRLDQIWDPRAKSQGSVSARVNVLAEVLDYFGGTTRSGPIVGANPPQRALLSDVRSFPNPFNPSLTLAFELGRKVHTRIQIYNLRGERIATLVDAEMEPGPQRLVWDGKDERGASVASGVYLYRIEAEDLERTGKVALVR